VSEDVEVDEETEIQKELEKLTSEAAAKAKRERRKTNEKKTKTIQRMQLQMTAPLDIGLEIDDPMLGGKVDAFDLGAAEKGGALSKLRKLDIAESGSDNDSLRTSEEESEAGLESEEERDRRIGALEDDLDDLYEDYKRNRSEKDAKFKAKEARKANKDREETWGGIRAIKDDSDYSGSDPEDEGSIADGGWEEMQKKKLDSEEDASSDEDSTGDTGSESSGTHKQRKRKREEGSDRDEFRKRVKPNATPSHQLLNGKRENRNLLTKLEDPKEKAMMASKASQLWFSQDIFSDVNRLTNVESDSEAQNRRPDLDEKVGIYLTSVEVG
jgi:AdoMet-dependent rRNA methyltransferase SPB1